MGDFLLGDLSTFIMSIKVGKDPGRWGKILGLNEGGGFFMKTGWILFWANGAA